ncbi:MAG TPA: hypothetical protein VLU46_10455 [Thermoanaerobaculia bacterium]|nr:hypothetical protein [Thermoanaerobaculia bacterium]
MSSNPFIGDVQIALGHDMWLDAAVTTVEKAKAAIVFVHGSGSGRLSPRSQAVAAALNRSGFATVLADLLTTNEKRVDEETLRLRFNISLLTHRVERVVEWVHGTLALPAGLFGSSTGAAAALDAAAWRPDVVGAVVSRGGRPDLSRRLDEVAVATLLIAAGNDPDVLRINEKAFIRLRCRKAMQVIPCATHLFGEPGTLDRISHLAGEWFDAYLTQPALAGV